jgi:curved DNA-binding protein
LTVIQPDPYNEDRERIESAVKAMEYKDYYKILGVDRKADDQTIKKAYRKLALEYHPDKKPGDNVAEERFKEINEAYEVLGDKAKRAKYDQLGSSYRDWQRRGAQGGFDWSQWMGGSPRGVQVEFGDISDLFGSGFSDFFNTIFGGQARSPSARRGRDIEHPISITLDEAYRGTTRMFQQNGRRIEVDIPPGAKTGTKVRVAGQGEQGGGIAGDLYLRISVQPDQRFTRREDDLYAVVQIDLYTAVLGGEVEVDTPEGKVMLSIPAGSQPGQKFRLKGQGMPRLRNPSKRGDLYAKLEVSLPRELSAEEKDMFEQLQNLKGK